MGWMVLGGIVAYGVFLVLTLALCRGATDRR